MSENRLRTIGGGKGEAATVAQIAALEFGAARYINELSKAQRLKKVHALCDRVRPMAVLAAEALALQKAELVERVDADRDVFGTMFLEFAECVKDAEAICDILRSAEARMAVAFAIVEGDDPT